MPPAPRSSPPGNIGDGVKGGINGGIAGGIEGGIEGCGALADGDAGGAGGSAAVVPATTLDAWAAAAGVRRIDLLALDVEGLEPTVLNGTRALLARRAVRALLFEYGSKRDWARAALRDVVADLDSFGYDCFYFQRDTLLRLTRCWHELFEDKFWSNVLCVSRGERALLAAATGLSVHLRPRLPPSARLGEEEKALAAFRAGKP
jgi:hypothetical protein